MAGTKISITKVEGVRRALQELGLDATADAILAFLKDRFGITMTRDHLYVTKGEILSQLAKKKPTAKIKVIAKKPALRPAQKQAHANGITRIEGIKQALKELGQDAKNPAIQTFLKDRYSMDIPGKLLTKYKGDIARRLAEKKAAQVKPVVKKALPRPQVQSSMASAAAAKPVNGKKIGLDDIQAVKVLMARVGPDQLRELITLLGT